MAIRCKVLLGKRGEADRRIRQGIPFYAVLRSPFGGRFILFLLQKNKRRLRMRKTLKSAVACLLLLAAVFSLAGCDLVDKLSGNTVDKAGRWADAIYRKDTELGNGSKTVLVEVKVDEKSVTFTINTDREFLGDALMDHKLLEGEDSAYGLYVKKVNGILADYDVDQTYWGLYKNGEYSLTGVDTTPISDGEHYELVCEG